MGTAVDALRKAAGEIGYYAPNDPLPGSKYGRWEAEKLNQAWLSGPSTSVWWCAIFVSWVLDGIAPLAGIPGFNTNTILNAARKSGQAIGNVRNAIPGDIVLYDWNHNGSTDHIGIVELNRGRYIQTIEGNTSSGVAGSQSAGNGVYRRTRDWSGVAAILRPAYSGAPSPAPSDAIHLDIDGLIGYDTIGRIQQVVGTPVDHILSHQYLPNKQYVAAATTGWEWDNTKTGSQAWTAVQKILGTDPDGLIGPNDIKALEIRYGFNPDGRLDYPSNTVKELQNRLNQGRI